ncbi:M28 family peptidase [Marinilongibacter aquaticus]|uniref:M28 family peptidase n=1 Tax=Marinilongibacter aquaticus TaxID=2975157 RepID=UPI0021BDC3A8|nr:M28 family peptidase [Marinilongibacter aquaticus]UBM60080.1 M28 family peptidase [Marinilongibacter aquaticus]
MKKIFVLLLLALPWANESVAQKFKKLPEASISENEVSKHIRFLASDELLGRNTGEPGNEAAARYIAEEWRSYGVQPINGSFLQEVPFERTSQPKHGRMKSGSENLKITEDFLMMNGKGFKGSNLQVVRLPYAWASEDGSYDDFKDLDVAGKVIVAQIGHPETKTFGAMLAASRQKEALAKAHGAFALIEIFVAPLPWQTLVDNLGKDRIDLAGKSSQPFNRFLINSATAKRIGERMDIDCAGLKKVRFQSANVCGILPGADAKLKNEYVILSAHFDHIGHHQSETATEDTIFNGARDNAIGVAGLIEAAKCLAQKPASRSILFLAFTGEEVGLKGSAYYAEHPLVPLNQCVFNLNIDGAGYDDTSLITGIGIKRTGIEAEVAKATKQMGLDFVDDPVPELGLFDRSDNVSFAAKGIPAPTLSEGFRSFSEEIMKYYHREADNPESLDFAYCTKFAQVYAYVARLIADKPVAPSWPAGDKYEKAYQDLFNK